MHAMLQPAPAAGEEAMPCQMSGVVLSWRAIIGAWLLSRGIPASLGLPLTEVNSFLLSLEVLTES